MKLADDCLKLLEKCEAVQSIFSQILCVKNFVLSVYNNVLLKDCNKELKEMFFAKKRYNSDNNITYVLSQ